MPKSQRIEAVVLVALCALGVLLASGMGVARAADATELSRFLDRDLPSFGYAGALASTTTVANTRAGALRDYDATANVPPPHASTEAGRRAAKGSGALGRFVRRLADETGTVGGHSPTRAGKLARQVGRSRREIKDAIHALKQDVPRGRGVRTPDLHIDESGEAYPIGPGGKLGDSIGNIHDHL